VGTRGVFELHPWTSTESWETSKISV